MSTINDLGISFLRKELKSIQNKIAFYEEMYKEGSIKCLVLKRLLDLKRKELVLLENILEQRRNEKK